MNFCKALLLRFAYWLVLVLEEPVDESAVVEPDPVRERVRELVAEAAALPGEPSGEWKRHYVLAQLKKEFPTVQGLPLMLEQVCHENI